MHRKLEISVPPASTDALVEQLGAVDGVVTLSVRRGDSVKPPGDVVEAHVLNRDVDEVLRLAERSGEHGSFSVSVSELDSLIDPEHSVQIRRDVDEVAWEDANTALRHHSRPTLNFFLATGLGGVVAACGLVSTSRVTEATALVAAAIMAPAFEPLARIPLGLVSRRADLTLEGARSFVLAYATLVITALLTMLVLRGGGDQVVKDFLHGRTAHEIQHPPTVDLIISGCGAVVGIVMVAAGRFAVLAGPVVALQLLPAAATIGIAIELGDGSAALHGLGRLAIDIGMVLAAGLLYFAYKHVVVHGRRRAVG